VKLLVVNADDFGLCESVNRGVILAHEQGIVTSASLMVRHAAAVGACASVRAHPNLSVGLHVDIAEWVREPEGWRPLYQVIDPHDAQAVRAELRRQLGRFRTLMGSDPTHLDSHQHVHREGPLAEAVDAIGQELGVPVRERTPRVRYRGDFYGQGADGGPLHDFISVEALLGLVAALDSGVTELACHPAIDDGVDSVYAAERPLELRALCDPRVREALAAHEVRLVSFAAVREVMR